MDDELNKRLQTIADNQIDIADTILEISKFQSKLKSDLDEMKNHIVRLANSDSNSVEITNELYKFVKSKFQQIEDALGDLKNFTDDNS